MANLVSSYSAPGAGPTLTGATLTAAESGATAGKVVTTVDEPFLTSLGADYALYRTYIPQGHGLTGAQIRSFAAQQTATSNTSSGNFAGVGIMEVYWYLFDITGGAVGSGSEALVEELRGPDFHIDPVTTGSIVNRDETSVAMGVASDTATGTMHRLLNESSTPLAGSAIKAAAMSSTALTGTASVTQTYSGLDASSQYYEHSTQELVVGGSSVFTDDLVTGVTTTASGGGGGTGGGSGAHDGTVVDWLVPRTGNSTRPFFINRGADFRNPTSLEAPGDFTVHLVTLEGVDITASWGDVDAMWGGGGTGHAVIPATGGELVVTFTYSGTRYTSTATVLSVLTPTLSNPLWASIGGGVGKWAQIPNYVGGTATHNPTSAAQIRSIVQGAANGSTIILGDLNVGSATIDLSGISKVNVTVKCANLGGIQTTDVVNVANSYGIRFEGFRVWGIECAGADCNLSFRHCQVIAMRFRGGASNNTTVDIRYCRMRDESGWRFQWDFQCKNLIFEQNILASYSGDGDLFQLKYNDFHRIRGNVFYEVTAPESSAHTDMIQFAFSGNYEGIVSDNFMGDIERSGEEGCQAYFYGDQDNIRNHITEFNVAKVSFNNHITHQQTRKNVMVRCNTVNKAITLETGIDNGSVFYENNIKSDTTQAPTPSGGGSSWSSSKGHNGQWYTPSPMTTGMPNWNNDPITIATFAPASGWEKRGASLRVSAVLAA